MSTAALKQVESLAAQAEPILVDGRIAVQIVLDGGWAIDVDAVREIAGQINDGWQLKDAAQADASERGEFAYDVRPVSLSAPSVPQTLSNLTTMDRAEVLIEDSGAISVTSFVELERVPLDTIASVTAAIYGSLDLRMESLRLANVLLPKIKRFTDDPVTPTMDSDFQSYLTVLIDEVSGCTNDVLLENHRLTLAQILLGETDALHEERVAAVLEHGMSYHPDDRMFISWRGMLCIGGGWDDVVSVLRIVNVELFELKLLKKHVETRSALMNERFMARWRPDPRNWLGIGSNLKEVQLLAAHVKAQVQRIDNPLNLIGDSFLAEVYEMACDVLTVRAAEEQIKEERAELNDLESTIAERAAARRADILAIVGVLVAFSFFTTQIESLLTRLYEVLSSLWQ